jgi:hypothetical protein
MASLLRFAMAFYMGFGLDVYGYRTISDALLSLFQVRCPLMSSDCISDALRSLYEICALLTVDCASHSHLIFI